jgi:hypothetical protein
LYYSTVRSENRCSLRLMCLQIKLNVFRPVSTLGDIIFNTFYKCTATFRTQICRNCFRIKLNVFRPVSTLGDIIFNTFYKCTATFRTQICRKCLRIKLNMFRPLDITSNTLYKCTATLCPTKKTCARRLPGIARYLSDKSSIYKFLARKKHKVPPTEHPNC